MTYGTKKKGKHIYGPKVALPNKKLLDHTKNKSCETFAGTRAPELPEHQSQHPISRTMLIIKTSKKKIQQTPSPQKSKRTSQKKKWEPRERSM